MNHETIAPPQLESGNRIGLVASSNAVPGNRRELFENMSGFLEGLNLEIVFGETLSARDSFGVAAGSPQQRAQELHRFFQDPDIAMIWLAHGGACSSQVLPYLDFEMISRNPKIISGLSDNVVLLNAIHAKTGLITFVGPEAKYGFEGQGMSADFSQRAFVERFLGGGSEEIPQIQERLSIRPGTARGRLIGGNLTSFVSLLGTKYLPDCDGAILLLEGLSVTPDTAILMTQQLRNAGIFEAISGILVGNIFSFDRSPRYHNGERYLTYEEILLDISSEFNFPIMKFHEIGHRCPATYFPIGGEVSFDTESKAIKVHQGFVY